jgi:hypothetical protein
MPTPEEHAAVVAALRKLIDEDKFAALEAAQIGIGEAGPWLGAGTR